MGFRLRKSVKLLPGVRLNVGMRRVSLTVGGRGASVNIGKKGARANLGLPGTGISYSQKLDGKKGDAKSGCLVLFAIFGGITLCLTIIILRSVYV